MTREPTERRNIVSFDLFDCKKLIEVNGERYSSTRFSVLSELQMNVNKISGIFCFSTIKFHTKEIKAYE